jgi:hypothetical protein
MFLSWANIEKHKQMADRWRKNGFIRKIWYLKIPKDKLGDKISGLSNRIDTVIFVTL